MDARALLGDRAPVTENFLKACSRVLSCSILVLTDGNIDSVVCGEPGAECESVEKVSTSAVPGVSGRRRLEYVACSCRYT